MNAWLDFKYAWRLLIKSPTHSMLSAIVVALSVGLALFIYVIDYNTLWKPLPFPESQRWLSVQIAPNATSNPQARFDAYTAQQLLERSGRVQHVGSFGDRQVVMSEGQSSIRLRAGALSPSLLSAMKVQPLLGTLFDASDGQPGAAPTVLLGYSTWQNSFAGDPAIVGKSTQIDGRATRIIGVMPQTFYAFQDYEVWVPLQLGQLARPSDSTMSVAPIVILKDGETVDAARSEMQAVIEDLNRTYPQLFDAARNVRLIAAYRMWVHSRAQVLAMASFIAIVVLLLGCLNISMIFFARLLERNRELALRTALGSARLRLLRQCTLEGLPVVLLGLALGIVFAQLGISWMQSVQDYPAEILATGRKPDYPVIRAVDLLVGAAAAIAVWLLSTLIPAWRISKQDPAAVLAGSGKGTSSGGRARAAGVLVGLQVMISSLLLVICANVVFAVNEELSEPTGVQTDRVMVSTYPTMFDDRYPDNDSRQRYWEELQRTISARIPGAEAAYSTAIPARPAGVAVAIEGQEGSSDQGALTLPVTSVSDNYFALLGVGLRTGRLFDSTDNSTSLNVAVIDENTAQRYWPQEEVVGKRVQVNPGESGPWLTIVGVVSAVNGAPYSREVGVIYRPLRQAAPAGFHLVAKLPIADAAAKTALREAAFAVDQNLPLHNLQLVDNVLFATNGYRSMVPGFTGVASITFVLAAIGLIGLITRAVAQRTQEVGIRRALGSTSWQIMALFIRQGAIHLSVGIVGAVLGIGVTTFMAKSIPNVLNRALPVTIGVLVLLAIVIFIASSLPARRAVALEPGDALRYE